MATKAERFKAEAQRASRGEKSRTTGKAGSTGRSASSASSGKVGKAGTSGRSSASGGGSSGKATNTGNVDETAGRKRRPRVANPAAHNESRKAAKNSPYEFEVSQTSRPSRKSTRRSPTHVKPDSPLRITEMNKNVSPKTRAGRERTLGG